MGTFCKANTSVSQTLFRGMNDVHLTLNGDPYHIETSPLICSTNQWIGFYMIVISVMKELKMIPSINYFFCSCL